MEKRIEELEKENARLVNKLIEEEKQTKYYSEECKRLKDKVRDLMMVINRPLDPRQFVIREMTLQEQIESQNKELSSPPILSPPTGTPEAFASLMAVINVMARPIRYGERTDKTRLKCIHGAQEDEANNLDCHLCAKLCIDAGHDITMADPDHRHSCCVWTNI